MDANFYSILANEVEVEVEFLEFGVCKRVNGDAIANEILCSVTARDRAMIAKPIRQSGHTH